MAVSVIDTRREFKLVTYSGDDEQWPQWVLKFEAWSELVGWGRHLDVASQSTLQIVNNTLDAEVQTISRQLYAILVVTLDGKSDRNCPAGWQGRRAGSLAPVDVGASLDNDGDVAALKNVDDFVMDIAGTKRQLVGDLVFRACAVLGSTRSLLLDSGSDEHLCTAKFADLIPRMCSRMIWQSEVRKLCHCWWDRQVVYKRWKQRPHSELLWCATILNETACVWRLKCCNVLQDLGTWRLEKLLPTSTWKMCTSKSLMPRRVLNQLWNHQLEYQRHPHLRGERGQPSKSCIPYGTKDVLFRLLCTCEQIAAEKKKEEEYLVNKRKE